MEIIIDFDRLEKVSKGNEIKSLKSIQATKGYIKAIKYNNNSFIELETEFKTFIPKDYVTKYSMGGKTYYV